MPIPKTFLKVYTLWSAVASVTRVQDKILKDETKDQRLFDPEIIQDQGMPASPFLDDYQYTLKED